MSDWRGGVVWNWIHTKCSSRTKMPLPIIATPIDILVYTGGRRWMGDVVANAGRGGALKLPPLMGVCGSG